MDRNWRTGSMSKSTHTDGPLKDEFSVGDYETVRLADDIGFECASCGATAVLLREMDGEACGDSDE